MATAQHRGNIADTTEAYYIGLMNSCGFRNKDLGKPTIAIVNSWTDANPGHKPRRGLAQRQTARLYESARTPEPDCRKGRKREKSARRRKEYSARPALERI